MLKPYVVLAVLLGTSQAVQAVPTYYFDGQLAFDAGTGALDITAVITDSADLSVTPVYTGSSVEFHATFSSASNSSGVTTGDFTGAGGTDFSFVGGDSTVLLDGSIISLSVLGADGNDFGVLTGEVTPTGGTTLFDFSDPSSVFSLVLNLDTMFDSDFTGHVDGRLQPVPDEPSAIPVPAAFWLFGSGLLGLLGVARRRDR